MKDKRINVTWPILIIGVVIAGGFFLEGRYYGGLEQAAPAADMSNATMQRLVRDLQLSSALRKLHAGDVQTAVRDLHYFVCDDIISINRGLAAVRPQNRVLITNALAEIALVLRSNTSPEIGAGQGLCAEYEEAAKILQRAVNAAAPANKAFARQ
jgi:hypothetical protein